MFWWWLPLALVAYQVYKCFYNLYFHPLSRYPGPKVVAAGTWFEFYYDVIKDGLFLWEIEKMHHVYGPIVRISPDELHILDASFYGTIYAGGSRRVNKDPNAVAAFAVPAASLATVDHGHHRLRRGIIGPYFSKRAVVQREPLVHEKLDRLFGRLKLLSDPATSKESIVDLDAAFAALTADIITHCFYGEDFDYIGNKDFKFDVRDAILGLIGFYHLTRFFPFLASSLKKLPTPLLRILNPGAASLLTSQADIQRKIQRSLKNNEARKAKTGASSAVITEALTDFTIPPAERALERLGDEGTNIIFAGTETTARALSTMIFYLLNDGEKLRRLREELATVSPSAHDKCYTCAQLENVPYLRGVVNEGLRLSHGPLIRLPRIATHESITYRGFVIPPGTPVSQSGYFVHMDPTIFPNPKSFDPERWTGPEQERKTLDRYIVSFSKGSRQCLGINLAYAEMYLTIVRIVQSFEMELHDTTEKDLEAYHVRITGHPQEGHGAVKVRILGSL